MLRKRRNPAAVLPDFQGDRSRNGGAIEIGGLMTKEEIIDQLEDLAHDTKGRIDPEDPEDVFRRDYEALTGAAEILKGGKRKWTSISTEND